MVLVVLAIFISPLTDLLPAPHLKHKSTTELLAVAIAAFVSAAPLVWIATVPHCSLSDLSSKHLDLLERNCTFRC